MEYKPLEQGLKPYAFRNNSPPATETVDLKQEEGDNHDEHLDSVNPEDDEEGLWPICGDVESADIDDQGLLCDQCDKKYHVDCLKKEGYDVDDGAGAMYEDWLCTE